jgi:4-hydroxy-2-oxoheptanedioate aldolase
VRSLLDAGDLAVTAWLSSGDPYSAEVLGHSGYDAVTVDLQHGMFGVTEAIRCLQAISSTPAAPLVRSRHNDAAEIGQLLDAGAYGVICPQVDSAEQAAHLVAACRYPPVGRRSFGPARGLLYGGPDYAANANDTVLAIAMVESPESVAALDAILSTPGLDAVYVGPNDLSIAAGYPAHGPNVSVELADTMQHIATRAAAHSIPCGAFALTAEQAVEFTGWGYRLLAPGNDMHLLRAESARRLAILRRST